MPKKPRVSESWRLLATKGGAKIGVFGSKIDLDVLQGHCRVLLSWACGALIYCLYDINTRVEERIIY